MEPRTLTGRKVGDDGKKGGRYGSAYSERGTPKSKKGTKKVFDYIKREGKKLL